MKQLLKILFFLVFVIGSYRGTLHSALSIRETSDTDFIDGTFSNTTVIGSGIGAHISLSTATLPWWNLSWQFKRPLYIWNNSGNVLVDYQVTLTFDTRSLVLAGKMNANGSDIRFLDTNRTTVLNYWIESGMNSTGTRIVIRCPHIPANSFRKIYFYYGNINAFSMSSASSTFDAFDNFNTNPANNNRWLIHSNDLANAAVWANDPDDADWEWFLTRNQPNRASAVFSVHHLTGSWRASFRYKVTNHTGINILDGHEGFVFTFYKDRAGYVGRVPDHGHRLGFSAGWVDIAGYGIEFDAVSDGVVNQNGHIALIKDSIANHLTYYHIQRLVTVTDEQWNNVEVVFMNWQSSSTVWLLVNDAVMFTGAGFTTNFNQTHTGVGFTAATGGGTLPNNHIIDDFVLRKTNIVEPTIGIGDELPRTGFFSSGVYFSNLFSSNVAVNYGTHVSTRNLDKVITRVSWNEELLAGTTVEVYVIGSNAPGHWERVSNGDTNISAGGLTIAYRLGLSSDFHDRSPRLNDISIEYRTKPIAAILVSTFTGAMFETVTFNAGNSFDADGRIINYLWDFGDGEVGFGPNPTHTYRPVSSTTTYNITLTVQDNDGHIGAATAMLTYGPFPSLISPITGPQYVKPVAVAGPDRTARVNERIVFDGSKSYDPDGWRIERSTIVWDFGDGSYRIGSYGNLITTHTYVSIGTYTVTLWIYDDDNNVSTDTLRVHVVPLPQAPQARIGSTNQVIRENRIVVGHGDAIIFDATSSIPVGGSVISYLWNFGDGAISTAPVMTHTYASVTSSYTVNLRVSEPNGLFSEENILVVVSARPIALPDFRPLAKAGERIFFDASTSYDIDGTVVRYSWDFGDGSRSVGVNTSHTYLRAGTYRGVLIVTDDKGLTGTKEFTIVVEAPDKVVATYDLLFTRQELGAYPVPFSPGRENLKLRYYLTGESDIDIAIYDLTGRMVKTFELPRGTPGTEGNRWNEVEWSGKNFHNEFVNSGVYIIRMMITSGDETSHRTRRVAVLRTN